MFRVELIPAPYEKCGDIFDIEGFSDVLLLINVDIDESYNPLLV